MTFPKTSFRIQNVNFRGKMVCHMGFKMKLFEILLFDLNGQCLVELVPSFAVLQAELSCKISDIEKQKKLVFFTEFFYSVLDK